MKKTFLSLTLTIILFGFGFNSFAQENTSPLKHWMTAEELLRKDEIGKNFVPTDPPPGEITNVSEFMPMQGVLVRYPFGIPINLIAEMSQVATVTTIVNSTSQQTTVTNQYQNAGVNMDNTNFLIAPTNSYWTRDYGPWFVIDGNQEFGIVDFPYNRPRPDDNNIPPEVAEMLDINLWGMNLISTGGNYMTDGYGISASTDLIDEENPSLTAAQIAEFASDYLGVDPYYSLEDPLADYIKHIDCWGKYLDVDKVIIGQVPTSDPRYDDFEEAANFFANTTTSWGNKYEVFRVYTPGGYPATPYSNSLILNDHVFLPQTGSQWDDEAITAYEEAMPGYVIVPVMQSNSTPWENTDALHCRTKGIADLGMLQITHYPLLGDQDLEPTYEINATIIAHSEEALIADSVLVFYRINNSDWMAIEMSNNSGSEWTAEIPGGNNGSQIDYYIFAKDESDRRENHPYIGRPDPHTFWAGEAALTVTPDTTWINNTTELPATITVTNFSSEGISFEDIEYTSELGYEIITPSESLPFTLLPGESTTITYDLAITAIENSVYEFGEYKIITDNGDTPFVAAINQDIFIGVEKPILSNLSIFPNPAATQINISLAENENQTITLEIIDLSGKIIHTQTDTNNNIVWNIPQETVSGIYFCRISNGEEQIVEKIIIRK